MLISRFFKVRYLVALILLVVLVAAVGNAAALNIDGGTYHNVVQGDLAYSGDVSATVTYTIEDNGDVTATLDFGPGNDFEAVRARFNSTDTYADCSGPGSIWTCTLGNGNIAGAYQLDVVAVSPNSP